MLRHSVALVLLLSLSSCVTLNDTAPSEIRRFWNEFPGHENTLASYGYDRAFAASAKPDFIDGAVSDLAVRPSQRRESEYLCVLYFMDRSTVSARLSRALAEGSMRQRRAARRLLDGLKKMDAEAASHEKDKKPDEQDQPLARVA